MDTKAALYRAAQTNVNIRRQQAEEMALRNQVELRRLAPEYEQRRRALLTAQIEHARRAAMGMPQQETEERVQQASALVAQSLADAGFTAEQLQPAYHCAACNDSGRSNGVRCRCVEQEMRRLRREQINKEFPLNLSDFAHFSLDYYSTERTKVVEDSPEKRVIIKPSPRETMTGVLDYCRQFVGNFGPKCSSILLCGDAGVGKTHLALAVANQVLDMGYDVVYVSAQQAFAQLDAAHGDGDAWLEAMLEADLLILDDLGTEYVTPHTISMLYQIVNTRLCSKRPTVYTTNIVDENMLVLRYTEKVASRLLGGCSKLECAGEDIRIKKRRIRDGLE